MSLQRVTRTLRILNRNSINRDTVAVETSRVLFTPFRKLSTSSICLRKRDPLAHEKMPIYDYGGMDVSRKRFYVFGSTREGALGISSYRVKRPIPKQKDYMTRPVRNAFGGYHEVIDVEYGHGFLLIRVKDDKGKPTIFGTGLNTHSQLGYHARRIGAPLAVLFRPVPLTLPAAAFANILAMGCGRAHSLFSLSNGDGILAIGDNSNGQCGRLPISSEEYFGSQYVHRIQSFGSTVEDDVVGITARFDITYCLTRNGRIYSFGANNKGQLGRGPKIFKHWEPGLLEGDLKNEIVVKIATSGNSAFAITKSGNLFAWGCNEVGHLHPEERGTLYYEPKHVKLSARIGKVKDISVGEEFSHLVSENGNVYTWGVGECLGIGPTVKRVVKPTLMPPPLFGCNDLNPDIVVDKISSGFFHVAAINSRGDVYIWGRNESGCLGLGLDVDEHQYFPLRVSVAGFAEKVRMGVDSTTILCRGGV